MKKIASVTAMFFMYILILSASVLGQAVHENTGTISGRVIDKSTGKPVYLANVFIVNTFLGSATDEQGYYTIRNIPAGIHEIVFSHLSFSTLKKSIRITAYEKVEYNTSLSAVSLQAQEITVTGEYPENWKSNLARFEEAFLGTSEFSPDCTILNPEVLDFKIDDKTKDFFAAASNLLHIINKALGYRILIYLEDFRITKHPQTKDELIWFSVKPYFEELIPLELSEREKWDNNRHRIYAGSFQYFIRSLCSNNLENAGFVVQRTQSLPPTLYSYERLEKPGSIDPASVLIDAEYPLEKYLQFSGFLRVSNIKNSLLQENISTIKNPLGFTENVIRTGENAFPTSYIKLNTDKTLINISGFLYDPYSIMLYGYWGNERVAEMLPLEYDPQVKYEPLNVNLQKGSFKELSESRSFRIDSPAIETLLEEMYDRGLALKNDGKIEEALNTWYNGKTLCRSNDYIDPRLGLAFMESVAENLLKDRFEAASEMYMWAMSRSAIGKWHDVFKGEVLKIIPLLSAEDANKWNENLEKNDLSILIDIRNFWLQKDFTPSVKTNERLLEHWTRISHARKYFTKAKNSPYGTDDRGTIYVKYGEPDKKATGVLGNEAGELARRFNDILQLTESGLIQTRTGVSGNVSVSYIESLMEYPEYEVWVYSDIYEHANTVFLFGKPINGGFRLLDSAEELMSSQLFSSRNDLRVMMKKPGYPARTFFVSPGALVQLMFYRQLSREDVFFRERYDNLAGAWDSYIGSNQAPGPGITKAAHNDFLVRDTNAPSRIHARTDRSVLENSIIPVKLICRKTRLINDQNIPKLSVIVISQLEKEVLDNLNPFVRENLYRVGFMPVHYMIVRDRYLNETARYIDRKTNPGYAISAFISDHEDSEISVQVSSESYLTIPADKSTKTMGDSLKISLLSNELLSPGAPLKNDVSTFEMSDLIVGNDISADLRLTDYPFPVIPADQFIKTERITVYFELYHLTAGADNRAYYTVSYQIDKVGEGGILQRIIQKPDDKSVTVTIPFDSRSRTAKESLIIDISNLESARYELTVKINDTTSLQEKVRKTQFEIKNKQK